MLLGTGDMGQEQRTLGTGHEATRPADAIMPKYRPAYMNGRRFLVPLNMYRYVSCDDGLNDTNTLRPCDAQDEL